MTGVDCKEDRLFATIGCAHALVRRVSAASDMDHAVVRDRFANLPTYIVPLLDSPVGWHIIADAMGFSYSPVVH